MFRAIAELDLGKKASASVTKDFYRELLSESLIMADFVVILTEEITSVHGSPRVSDRIDVRQGVPNDASAMLEKCARSGYRVALVLSDAGAALSFFESKGYERCVTTSPGSAGVIQGWETWLDGHMPDTHGALVFGHDFDPIFIFEKFFS